ncbi:hypothetical protein PQC39_gp041 [Vibrio phage Vp_R1]|uniref:Uncharacterized protein n=1 Tax=Vibrio phage Vp_R1 TaxID=2059867 RepID=A0A2H5BQ16_9CAUD|nr:hypothetical protein PQC39_gp041 [Vibrio phage Vp_R1]AUG88405.1 hypothetical protein VPR_041 [Vibrio phage Vp_R1]
MYKVYKVSDFTGKEFYQIGRPFLFFFVRWECCPFAGGAYRFNTREEANSFIVRMKYKSDSSKIRIIE